MHTTGYLLAIALDVAAVAHITQVEKGLVDGVDVERRCILAEERHDTPRHRTIEGVVTGKYRHAFALEQLAHLEERVAHLQPELLGLLRARNHTSVVIAQNNDRLAHELGMEHPLT